MRLFIAEKPSVAAAIAAGLGDGKKSGGYYECGPDRVTWCVGHMFELAGPDAYTPADVPTGRGGAKLWRVEDLPIIPKEWMLLPKAEMAEQLATIGRLIAQASTIIHAGDPDREGQLLVDDVLRHFKNTKPVQRFWVSAQDAVSVRRGLDALQANTKYTGWGEAARARQRADWLIGMNLSRAFTLRAQRGGSRALLTVGRVQTPTLALVVARDREIEAFKPIPYHTVEAKFQHQGGMFKASWKPGEDQAGIDSEGRLTDTTIANALVAQLTSSAGQITNYKQEAKKTSHPLAFSLSDLTVAASQKFGYSADTVLKVCQALYETHKLTSYPRTDCAYLPESQLADAPQVIEALKHVNPDLVPIIDKANLSVRSRVWDDKKITAHHGIIPTMHKGNKAALREDERNIYELVVRTYIAQFYPLHEFMSTTVELEVKGEAFTATGKVITRQGWRELFKDTEQDAKDKDAGQTLPQMASGDAVTCAEATRRDAKTKAPSRFTEGTLTKAMENIDKFVTDPAHKKMLREGDGIGTSATRASVISELKRREFLEVKTEPGQKAEVIVSTVLGRSTIDALPDIVKSPVLTALYERTLKEIEQSKSELDAFVRAQETFIKQQVERANTGSVSIAGGKQAAAVSSLYKCMACSKGLVHRPSAKFKGRAWWGCSGYPDCAQTYEDLNGKPDYSKGRNAAATTTNTTKE